MIDQPNNAEPEIVEGNPTTDRGRFTYSGLERAIHERARIGILMSLISRPDGILFGDLKELCVLTDGNLNRHLKVLKESDLIEIWKGSRDKKSQTLCRITKAGKAKFFEYITELERVIADAISLKKGN